MVLDQGQDVWGETREVNMTAPKQTARPQERGGRPTAEAAVAGYGGGYEWGWCNDAYGRCLCIGAYPIDTEGLIGA